MDDLQSLSPVVKDEPIDIDLSRLVPSVVSRKAVEVSAQQTTVIPVKRSRSMAPPPEVWQGLPIANLPVNFDLPALQLDAGNPLPSYIAQPAAERTVVKRERQDSVEERLCSAASDADPDDEQSGRQRKKAKTQSQATVAITPADASFLSAVEMSLARGAGLVCTEEYEFARGAYRTCH